MKFYILIIFISYIKTFYNQFEYLDYLNSKTEHIRTSSRQVIHDISVLLREAAHEWVRGKRNFKKGKWGDFTEKEDKGALEDKWGGWEDILGLDLEL